MVTKKKEEALIKLDLGCGINKKEGFIGVDSRKFKGVDKVVDLTKAWPWKTNSVDEVHCSHMIEHLTSAQRCHFMNELWRVLKKDAKATIVAPHWASGRAYGDPTHVWPPVCEFYFQYLGREWRKTQAPHSEPMLKCNFHHVLAYGLNPQIAVRNQDFQMFAVAFYKEAASDIIATLTKLE